jgi:hypothetical protein
MSVSSWGIWGHPKEVPSPQWLLLGRGKCVQGAPEHHGRLQGKGWPCLPKDGWGQTPTHTLPTLKAQRSWAVPPHFSMATGRSFPCSLVGICGLLVPRDPWKGGQKDCVQRGTVESLPLLRRMEVPGIPQWDCFLAPLLGCSARDHQVQLLWCRFGWLLDLPCWWVCSF